MTRLPGEDEEFLCPLCAHARGDAAPLLALAADNGDLWTRALPEGTRDGYKEALKNYDEDEVVEGGIQYVRPSGNLVRRCRQRPRRRRLHGMSASRAAASPRFASASFHVASRGVAATRLQGRTRRDEDPFSMIFAASDRPLEGHRTTGTRPQVRGPRAPVSGEDRARGGRVGGPRRRRVRARRLARGAQGARGARLRGPDARGHRQRPSPGVPREAPRARVGRGAERDAAARVAVVTEARLYLASRSRSSKRKR